MIHNQLFIPNKIKVGYQSRKDTYTQRLAYVVYFDNKGVLRKETSWNGWRDKNIEPNDFENVPTEGFVLNKGVGGVKNSYSSWNPRNEYIRVYDPRNFEFEISVANLLFILAHSNCMRGKGLDGKFVYAWSGTDLVLVPTECQEYKASQTFTNLQSKKIGKKDMIPGCVYETKKQEKFIYLGYFDWLNGGYQAYKTKEGKYHIFVKSEQKVGGYSNTKYRIFKDLTSFATQITTEPVENFAALMEEFGKSKHASKAVELKIVPGTRSIDKTDSYWYRRLTLVEQNGTLFDVYEIQANTEYSQELRSYVVASYYLNKTKSVSIKNGEFTEHKIEHPNTNLYYSRWDTKPEPPKKYSEEEIVAKIDRTLIVVLASGNELSYDDYMSYINPKA